MALLATPALSSPNGTGGLGGLRTFFPAQVMSLAAPSSPEVAAAEVPALAPISTPQAAAPALTSVRADLSGAIGAQAEAIIAQAETILLRSAASL